MSEKLFGSVTLTMEADLRERSQAAKNQVHTGLMTGDPRKRGTQPHNEQISVREMPAHAKLIYELEAAQSTL